MNERPEISAVVISYNGMKFLPECLATLERDLAKINHELIVVDNGSHDGSPEYVRETFPDAVLIANETNLGFARAINIGLGTAKGEYLYLLNQDLRFHEGTAAGLLERLKSDETIGLIGPGYHDFEGNLRRSVRAFPRYRHVLYRALFLDRLFARHREFSSWTMGWFDHKEEMFVEQPMGAVMLLPRKVVERVGLMDESFSLFHNDVDYCRRIADAGYRLLYFPKVIVDHHVGASTSARPYHRIVAGHLAMYRYLRKYSRPTEAPLLWLSGLLLAMGAVARLAGCFFARLFTSRGTFSSRH